MRSVLLLALLCACNSRGSVELVTEETGPIDADGDGYTTETDCDDTNPDVNPGAEEIPYNGLNDDCRPATPDDDLDGDGYLLADDCDDEDAAIHPGAGEVCDGIDNNCDGEIDDAVGQTWYADDDSDGFGDPAEATELCDGTSGWVDNDSDCDDEDTDINPDADEVCDSVDNDCDGLTDDEDDALTGAPLWFLDFDGDDYGNPDLGFANYACVEPTGFADNDGDCDDGNSGVNPGAAEVCDDDNVDEDCDGLADDDDSSATGQRDWYADADGDGFGDDSSTTAACDAPGSATESAGDCDDSDSSVNPDAEEVCGNGIDDNCDDAVNDCGLSGDTPLWGADGQLTGTSAGDLLGRAVAAAGDVDGDGRSDLLVGAYGSDAAATDAGAAYLMLGPLTGGIDDGEAHATLTGESVTDGAGRQVASGGDVDGDGAIDHLISAINHDAGGTRAGAVYLVLGPVTGDLDLADADAKLIGERTGDYAGTAVGLPGDLNGDGHDDVLVGAPYGDAGGNNAGITYLLLGPVTGEIDLADADGELLGDTANDTAGISAGGAGDVDGDGTPDLIIGAQGLDDGGNSAGGAFVVYGPYTGAAQLSTAADAALVGESAYDYAGAAVAGAGDLDDDGYDDVLVGAPYHTGASTDDGAVYVVRGPVSGTLDLSAADAVIIGQDAQDYAGAALAAAGDVNGDGRADVLVGAYNNDTNATNAGGAWLLYGPLSGSLSLSTDADAGLTGERTGDYAGIAVAGAGDLNADGYDDVAVGAPYEDSGGSSAGSLYLLFGGGY